MYYRIILSLLGLFLCANANDNKTVDQSQSLYEIVDKFLDHARYDLQDAGMAMLLTDGRLSKNGYKKMSSRPGIKSIYTRWGRRTCPVGAYLVYEGFAAGGEYQQTGAPANYLCLPQNPDWDHQSKNPKYVSLIYGAEYEGHESLFNGITNKDVPCAVCQVPRSSVIMVPGKNICFKDFVKEYDGYLMAGYPSHKAASEYVCVDAEAEQASGSLVNNDDGKLFYFVRAKCGSLKCPPYKEGDDLTCVVCSYSP